MNEKVDELGLENTHFITPHGLDENDHYTTAYELALITDYALNIDKIKEVVKTAHYTTYINGYPKTISNTNELLGNLNGVTGVKTGFTNGAGRCLVTSVERDGFNIITVVLGADTKKIRTKDTIKLTEYIYSNYKLVSLNEIINSEFVKWSNINKNRIKIYKAKDSNITVKLEDNKFSRYPVKNVEIKDIKAEIENTRINFEAPVYRGTEIGNLSITIGNKQIINLKIYIDSKIERKNWKDYFSESLCIIK